MCISVTATFYTNNVVASKRALAIFGVGKRLSLELNEDLYRQQIETESNGAVWLSEVLSTHPTLPKRIQSIVVFSNDREGQMYVQRGGAIALDVSLIGYLWDQFTAQLCLL
ncbi:hypothetical protein [Shouchella patagoniensis]|uniref:hypothetical protein n=1 Tax=Shouchella patagoniensis TaxID=228576 RepID=UPI000995B58B|nr:hypothetical protein [Shouchella patagoniensis]